MPPEAAAPLRPAERLSLEWRAALSRLALATAALAIACAREWAEMAHQWWNIDTYNHILLVPIIVCWLVVLKRDELAKSEPETWRPGVLMVAAALALWAAGRVSGINLIAHAGAVGALQGAVVALLGLRVAALIVLPIAFAGFLVPFGDEIIPPLQAITAEIAILLTRWSGIPATIVGIHIQTPVALFIVAEACSGVKFLIAAVTLGVLVCFTRLASWRRRAVFMAAAVVLPMIANGVRAWGTIFVAQSHGVQFARGFDHIVYGWIFFGIVVIVLLAAAWPFFEREPEEHGWSAADVAAWDLPWTGEGVNKGVLPALGGILALALVAAIVALITIG